METPHFEEPEPKYKSTETFKDLMEGFRHKDPLPILMGAILASDNELVTSENRFLALFQDMQDGKFAFPESMKARVEYIEIYQGYVLPQSEQIRSMFFDIHGSSDVMSASERSKTTGYFVGERYKLTNETLHEFLEEWADNYEALEFFERCAKFLAIEN